MAFLLPIVLLASTYITDSYALVPTALFSYETGNSSTLSREPSFDWSTLTSSTELVYQSCYGDKFHCARLTVPLDWRNESNPNNVSLPIIRLPAKVPISDPNHAGTIIVNPGGPGGSGTLWALKNAEKLQAQLEGPKSYEILSFDPRGIFNSVPNAYCFDNAVQAEIWYDQKEAVGGLNSSAYALKFNWAAEKARGELCAATKNGRYPNGDNLRQHISTAYVARDVLEIVRKIDSQKLSSENKVAIAGEDCQQPMGSDSIETKSKLQFYGTSYGTFIGETFAALYPEHVGRMVLDANLDADNWVSRYEASIDDHMDIRQYFYKRCFESKEECDFYREEDSSPQDVENRFYELLDLLDEVPAYATGDGRATPITSGDLLQGFMTTTYQPLLFFKPYAKYLHDIATQHNPGVPFWQRPVPTKEAFTDKLLAQQYLGGEATPAVHCGDGPEPVLGRYDQFSGFERYLANLTERFGAEVAGLQADFKISCWSWPASLRTKWRFDGPFQADVPILFVNNRLDPATPAKSAEKMAGRYKGSVFLEQDACGHGALFPPSTCMWEHVRRYMHTGEMPEPGTVCKPNCVPFGEEPCEGLDASGLLKVR
ncbi:Putative peptidase S33 tripeptidyl aminopeptidase-like, alpha/Beta hydrolase [Septoria linicola]|uniref:Peptidase S33 tripeptidyl aminopeptidase-like, alpha/Beta hydrolase n=1 Tax=Septoria linicola TaxID=215465 RepID=A0A9Q9EKI1_9PEZI|nr:Putative peptidase S33 tripeptidyl aminopeptidase-like, alpha/Beta hydrolase [Septoria linicola]